MKNQVEVRVTINTNGVKEVKTIQVLRESIEDQSLIEMAEKMDQQVRYQEGRI